MNSIIAGYNNTATSTCSSVIGQNSISTCGSIGINGGPNPRGYQITDWKEDIMNKYHNRFIIKTDYDAMSFAPTSIIIDNSTNKEYKLTPFNMSNIMNETEQFIQRLIITIREDKINTIINGTES